MISIYLVGLIATLTLQPVAALPPVKAVGAKFFTSLGDQFFIKGVAYQLTSHDPLVDGDQCRRDAPLLQKLGANTIRVYHVEPSQDHAECMRVFSDAGIYVFIDLDTFDTQIEQTEPSWNQTQLKAFSRVMDAFQSFDNLAGFFIGNEVLTTGDGSVAAPYVKAAARDVKSYRKSKGYREVPIGYSAADIASLRPMLQNYLACGKNESEAVDFFALNAYEWCGQSSYLQSGYSQLNANVSDYNLPVFLSETGCNDPAPRTFNDQVAIFGPEMSKHWSGAIIYEWLEEANHYGLISYGPSVAPTGIDAPPDGFPRSGTPTPISPDFDNLSKNWKTLTPSGTQMSAYSPQLTPPPCPTQTSGVWDVNGDVPLPTLGQKFDMAMSGSIAGGNATGGRSGSSPGATGKKSGATLARCSTAVGSTIVAMMITIATILCEFLMWL